MNNNIILTLKICLFTLTFHLTMMHSRSMVKRMNTALEVKFICKITIIGNDEAKQLKFEKVRRKKVILSLEIVFEIHKKSSRALKLTSNQWKVILNNKIEKNFMSLEFDFKTYRKLS